MIDFLANNWLWIVANIVFMAMNRRGHGRGMHGTYGRHNLTHAGHQGQRR